MGLETLRWEAALVSWIICYCFLLIPLSVWRCLVSSWCCRTHNLSEKICWMFMKNDLLMLNFIWVGDIEVIFFVYVWYIWYVYFASDRMSKCLFWTNHVNRLRHWTCWLGERRNFDFLYVKDEHCPSVNNLVCGFIERWKCFCFVILVVVIDRVFPLIDMKHGIPFF